MRSEVVIVGGGASGLLLSQLLYTRGIDSVVVERRSKAQVLNRNRTCVLETGLRDLLAQAGVDQRLHRGCVVHHGILLSYEDEMFRIGFEERIGQSITVYEQSEITRDLYATREATHAKLVFDVEDVRILDANTNAPCVVYQTHGQEHRIDCDFIAVCDGFHGVGRQSIPQSARREFKKTFPFGWLSVLSEAPSVTQEILYTNSERGFALCAVRNDVLSRYCIQCNASDNPDAWTDTAFWDELKRRLPAHQAQALITGPIIEKSMVPLRSFVTEPMRWGRLFLCGDAAHVAPPTSATGLNTAASDVRYLFEGLCQWYEEKDPSGIDSYSERALAHVWEAERYSWWFTSLFHRFPDHSAFEQRLQRAEIDFLRSNTCAQKAFAQNYLGLPF